MARYFLYARKSTDEDDRQVLSIEAQVTELREFAAKEQLEIVASLCEAKTAKEPGRTLFGEMIRRIEAGEADGILSWHPDRLARNPIDGGKIIYLVDTNKLTALKFPTFWFEDTPQGKFMLNIAFGQSKYFIDNLSENVKRGFRQKLRRGEWPGRAPVGYLNELKNHTIMLDQVKYKLIRKLFEFYATGEYTFAELTRIAAEIGLTNVNGKPLTLGKIHFILKNPFYCGVFKFNGELYEAKHEPTVSRKLFDQVQSMMKRRGRPHQGKHSFIFTHGLMTCKSCGAHITAETKKGHIYYRCTKKVGPCPEKYLREEALVEQFRTILQKVSIPADWADNMLAELEEDESADAQVAIAHSLPFKEEIRKLEIKLERLLDMKLDDEITKSEYLSRKEKLIQQKTLVAEKLQKSKSVANRRLEPLKNFIRTSCHAQKIAREGDSLAIRSFLKNVGSNFLLHARKVEFEPGIGFRVVGQNPKISKWQGWRESNPRHWFWRPMFYH